MFTEFSETEGPIRSPFATLGSDAQTTISCSDTLCRLPAALIGSTHKTEETYVELQVCRGRSWNPRQTAAIPSAYWDCTAPRLPSLCPVSPLSSHSPCPEMPSHHLAGHCGTFLCFIPVANWSSTFSRCPCSRPWLMFVTAIVRATCGVPDLPRLRIGSYYYFQVSLYKTAA